MPMHEKCNVHALTQFYDTSYEIHFILHFLMNTDCAKNGTSASWLKIKKKVFTEISYLCIFV